MSELLVTCSTDFIYFILSSQKLLLIYILFFLDASGRILQASTAHYLMDFFILKYVLEIIPYLYICMLLQSCPSFCDPMDCKLPGYSFHGILQTRILEWIAMPSSRGSSWPMDQTWVSCIPCTAGRFFTAEPLGKPIHTYKFTLFF